MVVVVVGVVVVVIDLCFCESLIVKCMVKSISPCGTVVYKLNHVYTENKIQKSFGYIASFLFLFFCICKER